MDILVAIGALKTFNRSEWSVPSFIIPKKDGQVRFISDLSQLNKKIKGTPYPLTHIKYILNNLYNFTYATPLELIMGLCNIWPTDVANKMCIITTPLWKYKYNCLPTGFCTSPGFSGSNERSNGWLRFFQSVPQKNFIVASGSFEEHLANIENIMKHKMDKCKFVVPKAGYLRYIIKR